MNTPQTPDILKISRSDVEDAAPAPLNLGARVRELRRARDLSLADAAAATGLARSTLSKIENGQMSPTFDALRKLAAGLDIGIPQLFTPPPSTQTGGRMAVTRSDETRPHPTSTYEHDLMAGSLTRKAMLPYRTRVRARSADEFDGWVRHEGEEFLYVLTGVVRLYTEFYEPVELRRGDSAYYDATMGHNVISVSDDDATILWVTSMSPS